MCLAQGPQRSERQPLGLESSTLPLSHCAPSLFIVLNISLLIYHGCSNHLLFSGRCIYVCSMHDMFDHGTQHFFLYISWQWHPADIFLLIHMFVACIACLIKVLSTSFLVYLGKASSPHFLVDASRQKKPVDAHMFVACIICLFMVLSTFFLIGLGDSNHPLFLVDAPMFAACIIGSSNQPTFSGRCTNICSMHDMFVHDTQHFFPDISWQQQPAHIF